jgi:class 3 adenylate cyclase
MNGILNKFRNDKYYFLIGLILVGILIMMFIFRATFLDVVSTHIYTLELFGSKYDLDLFDGVIFTSFIIITMFTAWYFGGHAAFMFVSISWNFEIALFIILTGRYELSIEFVNIIVFVILYVKESPADKKSRMQRQIVEITNLQLIKTNIAFERFVPKEFINLIGKESVTDLNAGDSIQEKLTISFTDIRSFSKIAQKIEPQEVFDFLNSFLKEIGPVIRKNNGFIDKYLGDGIMALFPGCPSDAVKCAIEMAAVLKIFNEKNQTQNQNVFPIRIGTGIHTGISILGTLGEDERIETTVISDAVNLSSRLEELTKTYGADIIISNQLHEEIKGKFDYSARLLDEANVKGTDSKCKIIEVIANSDSSISKFKVETKEDYEKGVHLLLNKQYKEALTCFEKLNSICADDLAVKYHINELKNRLQ